VASQLSYFRRLQQRRNQWISWKDDAEVALEMLQQQQQQHQTKESTESSEQLLQQQQQQLS
jgi:hypothetical protein